MFLAALIDRFVPESQSAEVLKKGKACDGAEKKSNLLRKIWLKVLHRRRIGIKIQIKSRLLDLLKMQVSHRILQKREGR